MSFIFWLIRKLFLVKEIVSKDGEIHFRRYRLLSTPWFNLYIHQLLKSDEDRHMHDHPWDFFSLILKGSYFEQTTYHPYHIVVHSRTFRVGDLIEHDARDAHHITLKSPVVWTLVLTLGREREWGYRISENQWIDFKTYRQLKRAGKLPE